MIASAAKTLSQAAAHAQEKANEEMRKVRAEASSVFRGGEDEAQSVLSGDLDHLDRAELERLVGQSAAVQAQLQSQVKRARSAIKDSQDAPARSLPLATALTLTERAVVCHISARRRPRRRLCSRGKPLQTRWRPQTRRKLRARKRRRNCGRAARSWSSARVPPPTAAAAAAAQQPRSSRRRRPSSSS